MVYYRIKQLKMTTRSKREYPCGYLIVIIVFAGNITQISTTTTLSSDQLEREKTDLLEEVRPLDGEYEDLRSLVLGLGIPSLIISSSLAWFFMVMKGWQVEEIKKKVEMLEQKLSQENMNKTKTEISEHCIKELSAYKETADDNNKQKTVDISGDGLVVMDIEQ